MSYPRATQCNKQMLGCNRVDTIIFNAIALLSVLFGVIWHG